MQLNISFYYWHEIAGPMLYYSEGNFDISEEDLFMLLSSVEPFTATDESSLTGPYYVNDEVIMAYNRSLNYPEAKDERIRLMGVDTWVLISCNKEYELVLTSMSEIAKTILDMEFIPIEEINQLNPHLAQNASKAILSLF